MPLSLKRLQSKFVHSAIIEADPAFIDAVGGGGKLSAARAVEVYRSGYPARMSEALGETFEACWRILGDDDFFEACRIYARSTPSTSYNLSDYGAMFPKFLLSRFKTHAPFIGDLANLEWSFKELFHAKPHTVLAPDAISVAVKESSILVFGSAVVFLSFKHKVYGLWKRDRKDATPLSRSDWKGRQQVVLYKNGDASVYSRLLTAPEASALKFLREGRPLSKALAAAKGLNEESARDLFSFISKAGLIAAVR